MIKAIQTQYKGYHFRSRLEARWAVFFDALGLKWEYEPEGFELPDGSRYLPDFRVTNAYGGVVWYEVKPESTVSDAKFESFQHALRVFDSSMGSPTCELLSGDPVDVTQSGAAVVCPCCGGLQAGRGIDWHWAAFVYCWNCDSGPSREQSVGVLGIAVDFHKGFVTCESPFWKRHVANVDRAATAARSARFEHGQSGATL